MAEESAYDSVGMYFKPKETLLNKYKSISAMILKQAKTVLSANETVWVETWKGTWQSVN